MKNPTIGILLTITCLLIATATATAAAANETAWLQTFCRGNKFTTKLHFYVHDIRAGPNATLFTVANASITAASPTGFGRVNVFDDRITVSPDIASEEVGRAQGTTASVDLAVTAFSMNLNFFLTSGKFNGSTVTVVGRNQFADAQRELSVAGGAGAFREARGYAITSSYSFEAATNYSVIEYTVYVKTSRKCS
ncbi:dirigent protein 21-like [Salvia miltiorrhiza]|uniref:dirigent protein 21-like n=1 Tax=Salvia miltiorrhiza TaxID=226208 RepID=UPI0025ABA4C6|nr:dirigent protein 21-like [Salvia miltiorrhiza]